MNLHTLVGRRHFPFPGLIEFLTTSLRDVIHTASSFRAEDPTDRTIVIGNHPSEKQLKELGFPRSDPTIGKSKEELQAIRKEVVLAIQQNQTSISETIRGIIHITGDYSLDPQRKAALRNDLDARFSHHIQEMKSNEETLDQCDRAICKFFARRRSDSSASEQPIRG